MRKIGGLFALLLLSVGLNIWLYVRYQEGKTLLSDAASECVSQQKVQTALLINVRRELALTEHPYTQRMTLVGTAGYEATRAKVFWNTQTGEVFIKAIHLPKPSPDTQYCLWAIAANGATQYIGEVVYTETESAAKAIQAMPQTTTSPKDFLLTIENLNAPSSKITPSKTVVLRRK